MAILKHIRRLHFIDSLIKRRATGDLETLVNKNGLCKSAMASVLKEMKEMGFPIKYDRIQNTYYYENDNKVLDTLINKRYNILSREEASKIGKIEELCFSPVTVFERCKNE